MLLKNYLKKQFFLKIRYLYMYYNFMRIIWYIRIWYNLGKDYYR